MIELRGLKLRMFLSYRYFLDPKAVLDVDRSDNKLIGIKRYIKSFETTKLNSMLSKHNVCQIPYLVQVDKYLP